MVNQINRWWTDGVLFTKWTTELINPHRHKNINKQLWFTGSSSYFKRRGKIPVCVRQISKGNRPDPGKFLKECAGFQAPKVVCTVGKGSGKNISHPWSVFEETFTAQEISVLTGSLLSQGNLFSTSLFTRGKWIHSQLQGSHSLPRYLFKEYRNISPRQL